MHRKNPIRMINLMFNEYLLKTQARIKSIKQSFRLQLDKNEQTQDLEMYFKKEVIEALAQSAWNRYPDHDYEDIEENIASYCGLQPENILLCPGSASIITTLLNYFAINHKDIHITQPTYSLFDYHCRTYNISYTPWLLSEDLEYDYEHLPRLKENSVLIITSPNNPVGNCFEESCLRDILTRNPQSLIIVDGVYTEFCHYDLTPLVREYSNLIVLRSFSKAFPVAGLRLGYLCASDSLIPILRKLFLQFSISEFSLLFARKLLFTKKFMQSSMCRVEELISEREFLKREITNKFDRSQVQVFPSDGNFVLIRIHNSRHHENVLAHLQLDGIKILNTSDFPLLYNTIRVSIGTRNENLQFLTSLRKGINQHDKHKIQSALFTIHSN